MGRGQALVARPKTLVDSGHRQQIFDTAFAHELVQAAGSVSLEVRGCAMGFGRGLITVLLVDDDNIGITVN